MDSHIISVVSLGETPLGRCYRKTTYRVTSTRELSVPDINRLRDEHLLGYGQELRVHSVSSSKDGLTVTDFERYCDSGD